MSDYKKLVAELRKRVHKGECFTQRQQAAAAITELEAALKEADDLAIEGAAICATWLAAAEKWKASATPSDAAG